MTSFAALLAAAACLLAREVSAVPPPYWPRYGGARAAVAGPVGWRDRRHLAREEAGRRREERRKGRHLGGLSCSRVGERSGVRSEKLIDGDGVAPVVPVVADLLKYSVMHKIN